MITRIGYGGGVMKNVVADDDESWGGHGRGEEC